jgi:hypothetical protein
VRAGCAAIAIFAVLIIGIYFTLTYLGGPIVEPHIGGRLP